MKSRVYYRTDPPAVILQKGGIDVLSYKTVDDLVETHIKGLLAARELEGKVTFELLKKYLTPLDTSKNITRDVTKDIAKDISKF